MVTYSSPPGQTWCVCNATRSPSATAPHKFNFLAGVLLSHPDEVVDEWLWAIVNQRIVLDVLITHIKIHSFFWVTQIGRAIKLDCVALVGLQVMGHPFIPYPKKATMHQTDATSVNSAVPAAPINRPIPCMLSALRPCA